MDSVSSLKEEMDYKIPKALEQVKIEKLEPEEMHLFAHEKDEVNELSEQKPKVIKKKMLEQWALTLPKRIRDVLSKPTGKHKINRVQWRAEVSAQHILPCLLLNNFFDNETFDKLERAVPLVVMFANLLQDYARHDAELLRGYKMYENFKEEMDFHPEQMKLATAALLQLHFWVPAMVRHIKGTHTGAHWDLKQIRMKLMPSVAPALLDEVIHLFEYGCPMECRGYSLEENF